MKILSLYIENFGTLRDKKINFTDKMNFIYGQNEFGKTTISEFIKLMLYGQTKSSQNIRENERKRFIPWGSKTMSGEITIEHNDNKYIISRVFGLRKSDDKISVVNAVTGAPVSELCIEDPGRVLLGVSKSGFEKSLYIKQLSTQIASDNDDEILKLLINLSQSGDENVSYQSALKILDLELKEINGTRPKGKIPEIRDKISELYAQKTASISSLNQINQYKNSLKTLEQESNTLQNLKYDKTIIQKCTELYSGVKYDKDAKEKEFNLAFLKRKKIYTAQAVLSILFMGWMFFAFKPAIILGLIWLGFCIYSSAQKQKQFVYSSEELNELYKILKLNEFEKIEAAIKSLDESIENTKKRNTERLLEIATRIGDIKSKIENAHITPLEVIDKNINELEKQIEKYEKLTEDINYAKNSLNLAFSELQKGFGVMLNNKTSEILKFITNGRYSEVLVDEQYNMMVRLSKENYLHDAKYLSNGAYDQIYLSLRLAIISLLFSEMPIILDDAFTQYDDERLAFALEYLKTIGNQVIIFTCQKREQNIILNKPPY